MKPPANRLKIPPRFVRNHPDKTALLPPDEAGELLLRTMEARTAINLATADLLDIGCGSRFAASIINRNIRIGSYTGIDVFGEMIEFLRHSTAHRKDMRFLHWNVFNALYNTQGVPLTPDTELPTEKQFDSICFFSVFTHLSPQDTGAMLKVAARALKPRAKIFLTAFVDAHQEADFLDGVRQRPLLQAMYSKRYFDSLIADAGFSIESFHEPVPLMATQYVLRPDNVG